MDISTIEVKNCHNCPFCNNDNEFGITCNISVDVEDYDMPMYGDHETIPDACALKNNPTVVSLIKL